MAMNCQLPRLHPLLLHFLFTTFYATSVISSSSSSSSVSYSDHCSSIVPESAPTVPDQIILSDFQTVLTHFTGGDEILGKNPSESSFDSEKFVSFRTTQNIFQTETSGVYKIEARLLFKPLNTYISSRSSSYGSYYYFGNGSSRRSNSVRFGLNGFWSQNSGKLCMVGSAPRYSDKGEHHILHAVLKLNHAANATIMTSLISGKLESLSSSPSDPSHFKTVSILAFSSTSGYRYTMGYEGFDHGSPGEIDIPQNQLLGLQPRRFCSGVGSAYDTMKLEYTNGCNSLHKNCTPLGQEVKFLPSVMTLYPLQCSEDEHKAQYLVGFGNGTYIGYYKTFDPSRTLVAEGSWDEKKKQMSIVACRILNDPLRNAHVGDCSVKLSLRYPAFMSIRNRSSVVGQIWTNKTAEVSGFFKKIIFRSYNNGRMGVSGQRYEYSVVDRAKKLCPAKKPVERKGEKEKYPRGDSQDMMIHMSVERLAWEAYASPVFVGNQRYEPYVFYEGSEFEEDQRNLTGPLNISYTLTITSYDSPSSVISSTHSPLLSTSPVEISAEGVYDEESGDLCMLGCRDLSPDDQKSANASMDCELLLKFQFPPVNSKKRGVIKGSIVSMRDKTHALYFEHLNMSATAFYTEAARNSIWRMDLEVIMVLISNTLACISVVLQLFYVKKNRDVLPLVSLLMLLILTLGHMIPLVLNFEALFSRNWNQQRVLRENGGWIEANEVIVRVITMVAFFLQFRLLQLAYCARKSQENQKSLWVAEKKTLCVSLPLYILGGLVALLLNFAKNNPRNSEVSYTSGDYYQQHSLWGDLRSSAGLVLDGFLFPQILLNVFRISEEKALSHSFYIGTTLVRLLPHVYDLYRVRNYAYGQFSEPYIYANPSADFYSTAWDFIIPFGGLIFAVIVYFQQRFGGRCILPRRFREAVAYERLPVETSESLQETRL